MTLGQLFREIEQKEEIPAKPNKRITTFIKERNWLVHKCRKENEGYLYNPEKFPLTLMRIRDLADESFALSKYFGAKSEEYILSKGIMTREQLDYYIQKILDSWSKV